MAAIEELRERLHGLDGRSYGAYRDIAGRWRIHDGLVLSIDHVQGDPFAAPTRVSVHATALATALAADLPIESLTTEPGRVGLACHLATAFARAARAGSERRGSGRSGQIRMEDPGQIVGPQTAVQVAPDGSIEARFTVGLPARGRRVLGGQAADLLTVDVPRLVREALVGPAHDAGELARAAAAARDAHALRDSLEAHGLVAFVADGAVLPRRSGVDDRPLEDGVVPFESPPELRIELEAPHAGRVSGMGVPRGVTLVVGGGFHGKSTLLRAIEAGVYGHPPDDGRERVVAHADAVKIRAEDGRAVAGVDISGFIEELPDGRDTTAFTTADASGSTSQAASLVEALEAGARLLLIDEDTAATNFMIGDRRMQELVPSSGEPIVPLVDRVRELHDDLGISVMLVVGGSGDYLDVADTVVRMDRYRAWDVTARARAVAHAHPTGRTARRGAPLRISARVPVPPLVDAGDGRRQVRVRAHGTDEVEIGRSRIDLRAVEQLTSPAQARAVAGALLLAGERSIDGERTVREIVDRIMERVEAGGLDVLDDRRMGDLAAFRRHELAAALNRLRTLRVRAG
jgi:predicted ABC-class ATPase